MGVQLLGFPTVVFATIVTFAVIIFILKPLKPSKLDGIPTVGTSTWFSSWWARVNYMTNALDMIQEGYEQYKSSPFKLADLCRWYVVISHRKHVEELLGAPDDTLSLVAAINEASDFFFFDKDRPRDNDHHVSVIRSQLTRNIGVLHPEFRDEITTAFDDILDLRGNAWKCVMVFNAMQQVVCRTSNRVFVGLPLCHDPGWIDLNLNFSLDLAKGGLIVGFFPDFLKPVAMQYLTNINQCKKRARKLLRPIIEERQRSINECGKEYAEKPNDLLSWLIGEAEGPESTVEALTSHLLLVNFGAVHTTSHTFTHALLYLAENPQYIQILREEVAAIIENEGWSKAAVDKMRKIDSFLKECSRLESVNNATLTRKALKDFTFSDGTFIPKGTTVVTAAGCLHRDEALYKNAHVFEPFRFLTLDEEASTTVRNQFVTTSIEYLAFAHGRHACPGRFFVVNKMKTMLAHVVVTYDIKLPDNATRPLSLCLRTMNIADPNAKIMFRRRID